MSNEYQEALLESIDYLINNRVSKLSLDKTVTATINQCVDATKSQYIVNYNGGIMYAYAQSGAVYTENQSVYVLVPEGDFSKTKVIIGEAIAETSTTTDTTVSSAVSDYNMVGGNTISEVGEFPVGLNTYLKEDYLLLYKRNGMPSANLVTNAAKASSWSVWCSDSTSADSNVTISKIDVGVSFQIAKTSSSRKVAYLPLSESVLKSIAVKGKQFELTMRVKADTAPTDSNSSNAVCIATKSLTNKMLEMASLNTVVRSATIGQWVEYTSTIISSGGTVAYDSDNKTTQGLCISLLAFPAGATVEIASVVMSEITAVENQLEVDNDALKTYVNRSEALMLRMKVQTRLPRAHYMGTTGTYGLQVVAAFSSSDTDSGIKYRSYVLDDSEMDGNPFLYTSTTEQYVVFPIDDADKFMYVDSILAYSKDFVTASDLTTASSYGDDIFISDVEIYGLQSISAVNGDYRLRIGTPQGAMFTSTLTTLSVVGTLEYKLSEDLSDTAEYYWFKEDPEVTTTSTQYHAYGGSGWAWDKELYGTTSTMTVSVSNNKAYENNYKCVCVYKQSVVLKTTFTLYNEAAKRDIAIESDLGTKFSFDRGSVNLTCLVNGKSANFEDKRPDSWYRFLWCCESTLGTTLTAYSKTLDELQAEYDEIWSDSTKRNASDLLSLKNQMAELSGISWSANKFTYPVKGISTMVTFRCYVYLKDSSNGDEYCAGHATITLYNDDAVDAASYYILIENGSQVFQYSTAGVSPASDSLTDPQDLLPLSCRFYDPAGLEVDESTYSVKWVVPLTSTMLVHPTEGMTTNPANGKIEWYVANTYPVNIAAKYDMDATDNQVTAVVTYDGQEFRRDTDFLFTKVGENGTNGTDVVCKIAPSNFTQTYDDELFALYCNTSWTLQKPKSPKLSMTVYQAGTEFSSGTYTTSWTLAGGTSKSWPLAVSGGTLSLEASSAKNDTDLMNLVVKGSTSIDSQTYYAYYPVPIIMSRSTSYTVVLDKSKTLKHVLYNSDGRYPQYNENQGVSFRVLDSSLQEMPIDKLKAVWTCIGGMNGTSSTAELSVRHDKKTARTLTVAGDSFVSVVPDDIYSGEWCDNVVCGKIYVNSALIADIYVPVHMSLNTFGLTSLNAWDGNHIEINEDGDYILAPQIGAGKKDSNNRFTGVLMGVEKTYDADNNEVESTGLFGYSAGKRSIFLDAETGNATFGLPEDSASNGNKFNEGRIELVPGGESKLSNWTIGSRSLYNISRYVGGYSISNNGNSYSESKEEQYLTHITPSESEPCKPYSLGASGNYGVAGATIGIPHDAQGIIVSAAPPYLSIKGMPLTDDNCDIDFDNVNCRLKENDSVEVEIDPKKSSLFTIFRHHESESTWKRYPLVGFDSAGRFYTNAMRDGASTMGIGYVGAFGSTAADSRYVGATFDYDDDALFKFYVDLQDTASAETRTLHLSSGTSKSNEYQRSMHLHGKEVALYAASSSVSQTTDDYLVIGTKAARFGHKTQYLSIPSDAAAAFTTDKDFSATSKNMTVTTTGSMTSTIANGYKKTVSKGGETDAITGNYATTVTGNTSLTSAGTLGLTSTGKTEIKSSASTGVLVHHSSSYASKIELNDTDVYVGYTTSGQSYLKMARSGKVELSAYSAISITSPSGGIAQTANGGGGVTLKSANGNHSATLSLSSSASGLPDAKLQVSTGPFVDVGISNTSLSSSGSTLHIIEANPGILTEYVHATSPKDGSGNVTTSINGGYGLYCEGASYTKEARVEDVINVGGSVYLHKSDVNQNNIWVASGGVSIDGKNNNGYGLQAANWIYTDIGLNVAGKGMDKPWFTRIQDLYDAWDGRSKFPRAETDTLSFATWEYVDDTFVHADDAKWTGLPDTIENFSGRIGDLETKVKELLEGK